VSNILENLLRNLYDESFELYCPYAFMHMDIFSPLAWTAQLKKRQNMKNTGREFLELGPSVGDSHDPHDFVSPGSGCESIS
jgi:hypothetical protein